MLPNAILARTTPPKAAPKKSTKHKQPEKALTIYLASVVSSLFSEIHLYYEKIRVIILFEDSLVIALCFVLIEAIRRFFL